MRFDPEQGDVTTATLAWLRRFPAVRVNEREVEVSQWVGLRVLGALDYLKSKGFRVGMPKWTLALLVLALCASPVAAAVDRGTSPNCAAGETAVVLYPEAHAKNMGRVTWLVAFNPTNKHINIYWRSASLVWANQWLGTSVGPGERRAVDVSEWVWRDPGFALEVYVDSDATLALQVTSWTRTFTDPFTVVGTPVCRILNYTVWQ